MPVLTQVGHDILTERGHKNSEVYRGILRLLGQFGYISIEEVMFGFDLPLQEAINRLCYLERSQFVLRFSSQVKPESFFCLTPLGRRAVLTYGISDHFYEFHPSKYRLSLQNHNRMVVRTLLALKKIFKTDFQGWVSEQHLRVEGGGSWNHGKTHRIFDGEFNLRVHKEKYSLDSNLNSLKFAGEEEKIWRCGLELELTLKSTRRYEKQFLDLSRTVYDPLLNKQKIPLVLFLYQSRAVCERLTSFVTSARYSYGGSIFLLGEASRFLSELESAPLVKFIGKGSKEIKVHEMNHLRMQVGS